MSTLGDILILGLGTSGEAAARYCASLLGSEVATVTVQDAADTPRLDRLAADLRSSGIRVILGRHEVEGRFDLCIASPGIPPHAPIMASALSASARTISEIEFAYLRSNCAWVAVTGTNGKTTTTALIAHLLNAGGMVSRAVGNIGTPAIAALSDADAGEVLVAEVSSFQLALTREFHPRAAVLLNITPDHMDWHGSLEAYTADKVRIFANLTEDDVAVIDVDDPGSAPFADDVAARGVSVVRVSRQHAHADGATIVDGVLVLETRGGPIRLVPASDLQIRGPHNVSNALAAAATAHALGVAAADLQWGLRTFAPIEHRLEPVGEVGGAEWFNDSKATNPDAVSKAIAAFSDRPLVLLMGGRNKGNDFTSIATEAAANARAVVVFGEARDELARAFEGTGITARQAAGLSEAVAEAALLAHPGDAVVLSPACASFDEFANYEERGHVFKQLVAQLPGDGEL